MLYRILQMAWACTIGWIGARLKAKENAQVIKADQTSLDQKTVEAKAVIEDLGKLGQLKTTAAAAVKEQDAKVADDDTAVQAATEKVTTAQNVAAQVKPDGHHTTSEELEAKLDSL